MIIYRIERENGEGLLRSSGGLQSSEPLFISAQARDAFTTTAISPSPE